MSNFFDTNNDGILLRIRLTPNARLETFGDVIIDKKGVAWLKASVRAVPENGKANKALIAFIAKQLKLSKTSIEIVSGHQVRTKKLSIGNATDSLINSLKKLT